MQKENSIDLKDTKNISFFSLLHNLQSCHFQWENAILSQVKKK